MPTQVLQPLLCCSELQLDSLRCSELPVTSQPTQCQLSVGCFTSSHGGTGIDGAEDSTRAASSGDAATADGDATTPSTTHGHPEQVGPMRAGAAE